MVKTENIWIVPKHWNLDLAHDLLKQLKKEKNDSIMILKGNTDDEPHLVRIIDITYDELLKKLEPNQWSFMVHT